MRYGGASYPEVEFIVSINLVCESFLISISGVPAQEESNRTIHQTTPLMKAR
jgi:hypothetical protein